MNKNEGNEVDEATVDGQEEEEWTKMNENSNTAGSISSSSGHTNSIDASRFSSAFATTEKSTELKPADNISFLLFRRSLLLFSLDAFFHYEISRKHGIHHRSTAWAARKQNQTEWN